MLNDGQWHDLKEVRHKTSLSESRVQQIVVFLREYKFITVDESGMKVRLEDAARRFLSQRTTP